MAGSSVADSLGRLLAFCLRLSATTRVPNDESLLEEHSDRAQFRIASIRRQPARFPASGPGTFRNALPCCGPSIDYAQGEVCSLDSRRTLQGLAAAVSG